MQDILLGAGALIIVCILIMVLAIQAQIRGISKKVDEILSKLG